MPRSSEEIHKLAELLADRLLPIQREVVEEFMIDVAQPDEIVEQEVIVARFNMRILELVPGVATNKIIRRLLEMNRLFQPRFLPSIVTC